jgi:hypothetical protein
MAHCHVIWRDVIRNKTGILMGIPLLKLPLATQRRCKDDNIKVYFKVNWIQMIQGRV